MAPGVLQSLLSSHKDAPTPSTSTAFPQFRLLPKEIRLQIWRMSLTPRIIDTNFARWDVTEQESIPDPEGGVWFEPVLSPVPPQFHACQESRSEVLPIYSCLEPPSAYCFAKGTVMNFDLDVLYCGNGMFFPEMFDTLRIIPRPDREGTIHGSPFKPWGEEVVERITRLAILSTEIKGIARDIVADNVAMFSLNGFRNLREIILFDFEVLEGSGPRSDYRKPRYPSTHRPDRFKGPVEFVEAENWETNEEQISLLQRAKEQLKKDEWRYGYRWPAPEILEHHGYTIRKKNGTKPPSPDKSQSGTISM